MKFKEAMQEAQERAHKSKCTQFVVFDGVRFVIQLHIPAHDRYWPVNGKRKNNE